MSLTVRPRNIIMYFVIILCILDCNTIYSTTSAIDFKFPELIVLFLFFLLILEIKHLKYSTISKWVKYFIPYFFLNIVIILASVPANRLTGYCSRFLIFIPFMSLVLMIHKDKGDIWQIFIKLKNIVYVYAIVSLILWFLVCILNVVPVMGSIEGNWGPSYNYPLYFGIYTIRQYQDFLGVRWIRNIGFFTEAPMYNLVLLVAILTEVFICPLNLKKEDGFWAGIDIKKLLVLVVADITTFTTTGMIILVSIIFFKYCLWRNKTSLGTILKWFGFIFVALLASYVAFSLFLDKSTSGSWEVRADDLKAGLQTWKENILFGSGYTSMEAIEGNMSSFRSYNMGYSSGLFSVLAQGGLFLFSNYAVGFWGFIKAGVQSHRYELIALIILYIVIFVNTIFYNTFLMMLLLSYGYALIPSFNNREQLT